jgi:hypothetical protein
MYIDGSKARVDFHDLWSSCVGKSKYYKDVWIELELVLSAAILTEDAQFVEEVLTDARKLQVDQLELN